MQMQFLIMIIHVYIYSISMSFDHIPQWPDYSNDGKISALAVNKAMTADTWILICQHWFRNHAFIITFNEGCFAAFVNHFSISIGCILHGAWCEKVMFYEQMKCPVMIKRFFRSFSFWQIKQTQKTWKKNLGGKLLQGCTYCLFRTKRAKNSPQISL